MDEKLMDREVLCIIDTRQIQRFMFRSKSMTETVGASDLLSRLLDDAIENALENLDPPLPRERVDTCNDPDAVVPYFHDPNIDFQLIVNAAGNALFLARTGALAQQVIRRIARYYLDNAYGLNIAAAAVERSDSMAADLSELYKKLNAAKASSETLEPMGCLPICIREDRTGMPVVDIDPEVGDFVSTSSILKRREAKLRNSAISMDQLNSTRAHDRLKYRAVMHIDGNNIGITIGRILAEAPDYESGIRARRLINKGIKGTIDKIMDQTLADLKDYYVRLKGTEEGFGREFMVIHKAGDDINCVCNAIWAYPFLRFFYANLKGTWFWKTETIEVPLYMCAGVAFVIENIAFHPAFTLAEECCSSAKKEAKKEHNLLNGLAGHWVDFQVLDNPNSQNLEMLRERSYMTPEQISLLTRPYRVDYGKHEEDERSVQRLLRRTRVIKGLGLDRKDEMGLRQSYLVGMGEFAGYTALMRLMGIDLIHMLGLPLSEDDEGQRHAAWFDATDLSDFIADDMVDLLDLDREVAKHEDD